MKYQVIITEMTVTEYEIKAESEDAAEEIARTHNEEGVRRCIKSQRPDMDVEINLIPKVAP